MTTFSPIGPIAGKPLGANSPGAPLPGTSKPFIVKAGAGIAGPGTALTVKPTQSLPHPWTGTQG